MSETLELSEFSESILIHRTSPALTTNSNSVRAALGRWLGMTLRVDFVGLPGMVVSAVSMVVGAILYWAVTAQNSNVVQNHGFKLSTIGLILLIAGAAGFVVSLGVFVASRRSPSNSGRTLDRETIDEAGRTTTLHERQK